MYMLIYIIVHSIYIVLYLMVYMYILICIFVYIFVLCSSLRCTGTIYILYMLICLQYLYCTLPYGVHVQYTSYFVYSICIVLYLMVYRYNACIQVILFTVFVLYSTLWCTGTMYIYMLICLQYLYCTLPHGVQVQCIYTSY